MEKQPIAKTANKDGSLIEITKTEYDKLKSIDGEMNEQKWQYIAEKLWCLLDDIDTASDMYKPKKNGFYKYTMKKIAKRFELMNSNGYNIFPIKIRTNRCS